MANEESFVLDGVALNDGSTFAVDQATLNPPAARWEWVSGADVEGAALLRDPQHENRTVALRVAVLQQATMDDALAKIASVRDKLKLASATQGGIALVWTPATATLSCTFDVLGGEITDLPIDWENGWLAKAPTFTLTLTCKPYWRSTTEVLTSTASASAPIVTLEIPDVPGDVHAIGRIIVTDTASQWRRHVEWGLEGPSTYDASTSLLIDSDDLVTTGFAGSQTTRTGAYDPDATGNNAISAPVQTRSSAMCGTGALTHNGVFRVKARVDLWTTTSIRFAWSVEDGPWTRNGWVTGPTADGRWAEVDLGLVRVSSSGLGTHTWEGQVETYDPTNGGSATAYLDYLILVPVAVEVAGYGVATAPYGYQPGVTVAQDDFTGTTAGSALNGRVAPLGGTWATSGSATDFAFADAWGGEMISRSATGTRTALLGTTTYTNVEVGAQIVNSSNTGAGFQVLARYIDANNYVSAQIGITSGLASLFLVQSVAGVGTQAPVFDANQWTYIATAAYYLRLIVYASGVAYAHVLDGNGALVTSATLATADLATGGALASGKVGLLDVYTGGSPTRYFDQFYAATPADEPIAIYPGRTLEFRYDSTLRQNAAGTSYGRPKSYNGAYVRIPVGTSRVAVKARRNDVTTGEDDHVTDATEIQVGYTARGLVVPR